jgi:hypothetical protein
MRGLTVKPDYGRSGRIGLRVALPWRAEDWVLLRLPEAISHAEGMLFCEWEKAGAWPAGEPRLLPEWRWGEGGALGYECRLPGGVTFYVRVKPGRDEVDMVCGVENGSEKPLRLLAANMCAALSGAPEFCDRGLSRTHFLSGGQPKVLSETTPDPSGVARPPWIHCRVRGVPAAAAEGSEEAPWWVCEETADDGLVFVESSEGGRWAAMIWGRAFSVSANSRTPCVHSNPRLGTCAPGAKVEQPGRLLLYEGRRDLLCMRALDGFA